MIRYGPGVPFMQVVDPAVMQVHVMVNQEDLGKLTLGQSAQVHLDAYPDLALSGQSGVHRPNGQARRLFLPDAQLLRNLFCKGRDPDLCPISLPRSTSRQPTSPTLRAHPR